MAIITYMLSGVAGLFAAIVGYLFLGLDLADAFLVYCGGSIALGTLITSVSFMMNATQNSGAHGHPNSQTTT